MQHACIQLVREYLSVSVVAGTDAAGGAAVATSNSMCVISMLLQPVH